jgi:peptidoglycan/LPS O-acetylase OafA/YrhL
MTQLASRPEVGTTTPAGYRGDLDGLRALAVVLVLLCHAGLAVVPGGFVGVDVFFVLSGFLVTGLLADELARTGRISLVDFYARRAKRILPAAAVVLVTALPLAYLFLPRFRWAQTGWDVVASGLYVMNWRAADQAGDQLAASGAASLSQHFWALAVGAQFHLLWPLLLAGVGIWAASRWGGQLRWRLWLGLGLVALPSFAWSVGFAQRDPGPAFFVTTTRIWELALGAGLAILSGHLARLPRLTAAALGWVGIGAIGLAALVLTEATPYPGYAALLPTLGAAALIAAGVRAGRAGPGWLLGLRPVRAVGVLSYSLYLWHWPLLVIAQARFGELSPVAALAVLLGCAVPAVLTYWYVEQPLRRARSFVGQPARALQVGLLGGTAVVVAGMLFQLTVWPPAPPTPTGALVVPSASASVPPSASPAPPEGAAVLGVEPRDNPAGVPVDRVDAVVPEPAAARDDRPDGYDDPCLVNQQQSKIKSCVYGDRKSTFTVVLAGDSHAAQWVPALQHIARANKWKLITYTKASCPLLQTPVANAGRAYPSCTEWNRAVRARLTGADRPKLLITSSSPHQPWLDGRQLTGEAGGKALTDGFRQTWSALANAGLPTVVLRGTPQPGIDVPECVSKHRERLTECAATRESALAGIGAVQQKAASGLRRVHLIDLNDAICPADRCAAVIGGMLVYRDAQHLTASYAASLAPRLRGELDLALA